MVQYKRKRCKRELYLRNRSSVSVLGQAVLPRRLDFLSFYTARVTVAPAVGALSPDALVARCELSCALGCLVVL